MLKLPEMIRAEEALPGRAKPESIINQHFVLKVPLLPPFPQGMEYLEVGMGCFWGAERKFWQLPGVYTTAVGYAAGFTPNPTYREVCTGFTGHNEVVRVVFDPAIVSLKEVLAIFWQAHNPTQGMRQGNDVGTQYRSGIYFNNEQQKQIILDSLSAYQKALSAAGFVTITTEILPAGPFYYADDYHQQYLAKNPNGYCGLGGTGITCPI